MSDALLRLASSAAKNAAKNLPVYIVCVVAGMWIWKTSSRPVGRTVSVVVTNPREVATAVGGALSDTVQGKPNIVQRVLGLMAPAPPSMTTIYREYTPLDSTLISRLFLVSSEEVRGHRVDVTAFQQSTRSMMRRTFDLRYRNWSLGTNSEGVFINQYRGLFVFGGVYGGGGYGLTTGIFPRLWAEAEVYELIGLELSVRPGDVSLSAGVKLW